MASMERVETWFKQKTEGSKPPPQEADPDMARIMKDLGIQKLPPRRRIPTIPDILARIGLR